MQCEVPAPMQMVWLRINRSCAAPRHSGSSASASNPSESSASMIVS
jgi:hypothetical protein